MAAFAPTVNDFLERAYSRCGREPTELSGHDMRWGRWDLNSMFAEWSSRGINLWAVKRRLLPYQDGMHGFALPSGTIDVTEAYRRTSTYPSGGTAASSPGGTAAYAFDGTYTTACTQTGPNGTISYHFGTDAVLVSMLGVRANTTGTYTLVGEALGSGASTWDQPYVGTAHVYPAGTWQWAELDAPVSGTSFRIRETGGATLDVQELAFNTSVQDLALGLLSRDMYTNLPNKAQTGVVTQYWVERGTAARMYVWPAMDNSEDVLAVNIQTEIHPDTLGATDTLDIPQRLNEAVVAGLAAKLAQTVAPDKVSTLDALAEKAIAKAFALEAERGPVYIRTQLGQYYRW